MTVYMVTMLCLTIAFNVSVAEDLILNDLFPVDRVLDVQITVDRKDWDTIRFQSRNFKRNECYSLSIRPILMLELASQLMDLSSHRLEFAKKGSLVLKIHTAHRLKSSLIISIKKVELEV